MYTIEGAIHVSIVPLNLTPLIPLPPKAKLRKVALSMAILTMERHLSPRLLVHSPAIMVHSWLRLWYSRKGFLRDGCNTRF